MAKKNKTPYFPDETSSNAEKNKKDYGLKVGKAIEWEWFQNNAGGGVRYYDFQEEFHRLRRYARGEQSIRKYKDEFKVGGDLSYINLDWKPVPIIPKFKDIMVNNLDTRLFDIQVQAIDPVASKERGKERAKLERDMMVKQYAAQLLNATGETGLNLKIDDIADNPEELELHMQLNYKQGVEIAQEQAIDYVMRRNDFEQLKMKLIEDEITIGMSATKVGFNTADGITIDYVDPAKLIWSYTEDKYFKDCYYWGEIKEVTLSQLRKEFPHLTDKDIEEIQQQGQNKYNYPQYAYGSNRGGTDNDSKIQIMYFTYKTYNTSTYKKKTRQGVDSVSERDDSFKGPKTDKANYEKIQITREVLYEGAKIIKSDKLLRWELAKNMMRPKADTTKVVSPYSVYSPSMYNGRIESMVQRMAPYADLIQLTHLKLQQAIQRMVPDGVAIDPDALADIDLGGGTTYNPEEALNMYFQTGSIVARSMTIGGERSTNLPIQPIVGNHAGQKIAVLINTYNQYLNMIRDITGINEATDGSTISEYALPGTQKLAAANSSTAIRHLHKGIIWMSKQTAEKVSLRLSDVLEFSNTRDELIQSIGQFNVASIKDISKLHLHNFGIFVNVHPDEEEKARFQEMLSISLNGGLITPADVLDLDQITNVSLASQLLKVRQKKKAQQDQQIQRAQAEHEANLQSQAAQVAAESEAQKFIVKSEADGKLEQLKHELELQKLNADVAAKERLMDKEFGFKIQLAQMEGQAADAKISAAEDRKDERQREAASQNSKLIEQRNTKGPAQDFKALAAAQRDQQAVQKGGLTGPATFESDNDSLNPVGEIGVFDDPDL